MINISQAVDLQVVDVNHRTDKHANNNTDLSPDMSVCQVHVIDCVVVSPTHFTLCERELEHCIYIS